MLKKIAQKLDIDFDIGNTLLLRMWSTISGGMLVLMIPVFLSASEQGYYFTFSSIIAMQIFFELGFNFVITQMISHEMVKVEIKNKVLYGESNSISRIYGLISLLVKWYSIISILFFIFVFCFGYHFFSTKGTLPTSDWVYAWFFIVLFSAINVFVSPFLSVLEGMKMVGRVARIRLIQAVIGFVILTILFLSGLKLNALPAITGTAALFSLLYLFTRMSGILFNPLKKLKKMGGVGRISWRREIFPFQWRIAISWLSGYFIFQLFNPLVFSHQGAIAAGKIGLSLTIYSTILALSISWVNAKLPDIARYISGGEKDKINPFFVKLFIKSILANVILSSSFVIFVYALDLLHIKMVSRLADMDTLLLLVVVNAVNHIVFCLASYMRAHKEEPMLLNSIVTGVGVGITVYFTSMVSVFVTILSYALILLVICLPWTVILFKKYYTANEI